MSQKIGWFVVLAAAGLVRGAAADAAEPDAKALAAEFQRVSGARLVFEAAELPPGTYHDVMVPLPGARRAAAARIALAEVRKYPPGYLGDVGLGAIGVFAACISKEGDGFRPYDAELKGYRYFGIWNGKDGIAGAYYTDSQLPLTLHHEIFHHVDATVGGNPDRNANYGGDDARFSLAIAGLEPYPAPVLSAADRAALAKLARGVTLSGAVSDYADKNPNEDQAETARHLMTELPDALLQMAAQPKLPGSQRMLHVLAEYEASLEGGGGPAFAWLVDVALGRAQRGGGFEQAAAKALGRMRARIEPQGGSFVVWGNEDASGVNWTLRNDVAGFGTDARKLGQLARQGGITDARVTRVLLERARVLARYHGWIAGRWKVSAGTRQVFEVALGQHWSALPQSRAMLAETLRLVPVGALPELLAGNVPAAADVTERVMAAASAARLNPYIDKVNAEITDPTVRAAIRAVQPATVKIGGGSGVNLSPAGRILTAGHVPKKLGARLVAEFPDGKKYDTVCTAFDATWDIAVMTVVGAVDLPYVRVAARAPVAGTAVVIIGQPGQWTPDGEATGYQPFHVSSGKVRGFLKDLMGSQRLGATKHDAWTYWGHSGSPLFDETGALVAVHNSWDSTTAMRHAVPHQVITRFLTREHVPFTM